MPAVTLALLLFQASAAPAQDVQKGHYKTIEIVGFDVQQGVEFPADYLVTLTEELVAQLTETKKFKEVLRQGERASEPDSAALRLIGTVTQFNKGSRAKRYLVGFGAGKTKIVAHIKILDRATESVLLEDDVDGNVAMGFAGGDSIGATRGLAKEVAKVTKKAFF